MVWCQCRPTVSPVTWNQCCWDIYFKYSAYSASTQVVLTSFMIHLYYFFRAWQSHIYGIMRRKLQQNSWVFIISLFWDCGLVTTRWLQIFVTCLLPLWVIWPMMILAAIKEIIHPKIIIMSSFTLTCTSTIPKRSSIYCVFHEGE